jgi:hypothetical protein
MLEQATESSQNLPTTDTLIGQLDAEVRLATAQVTGSGWTASGVLIVLLPVLWAFISEFRTRWSEPITVSYNWMLVFLLLSIFFDALDTFPKPHYRRFYSPDIRERLQWTHLFNYRVNLVDLIRYLFLFLILIKVNFGVEWYVATAATTFYVLLLLAGLIGKFFEISPILVPFNRTLQYKYYASYFLAVTGLMTGGWFLKALTDNSENIHAPDLLIAGLAASLFYLLRVLFTRANTPYVMALEEIRHDLAVADIEVPAAKQRLAFIKSGMLLVEAVEDYTVSLRLLLRNMHDELKEAIRVLDSKSESISDVAPDAQMLKDASPLVEQWAAHNAHYKLFSAYMNEFKKGGRSRRFRLYNWLVRLYRRSYFHSLTTQTRKAIKYSFESLRTDYESCNALWEKYVDVRQKFVERANSAEETKIIKDELDDKETTLRLPDSLVITEAALLERAPE